MSSGDADQLQRELVDYTASLYREGYVNEQFTQLQSLQDESNPDFVAEVFDIFFKDSQRLLDETEKLLIEDNVDFKKLDTNVHQLKGSSSSIGARKVQNACVMFRHHCYNKNIEGCVSSLQQAKNECTIMKTKLETLIKLEQQIVAAGGSIPKRESSVQINSNVMNMNMSNMGIGPSASY